MSYEHLSYGFYMKTIKVGGRAKKIETGKCGIETMRE